MSVPELKTEREHLAAPSREAGTPAAPLENGRWKAYGALLLSRMKEMWREPEVTF